MFYESWFNLAEPPFSISPDPRYLYLTKGHQEALAHLLYGASGNGGFVLLTGEIGAGKTTVCRCLLEQLPEDVDVALVLSPRLEAEEFLQAICDELHIELSSDKQVTLKTLVDGIYKHLLAAYGKGRNTVLIVDEAQNLSPDVLEHLRLLTNLETNERKLLQIMLIGQPELRDLIGSPAMQQMAQRITARFHLDVLSLPDTEGYIKHRLAVAGCDETLFDKGSVKYIWKRTGGVPRLINGICDRSLLGARVEKKRKVTAEIARQAAMEVMGESESRLASRWFSALKIVFLIAGLLLVSVAAYERFGPGAGLKERWLDITRHPAASSKTINFDDNFDDKTNTQKDLLFQNNAFVEREASSLKNRPGASRQLDTDENPLQPGVHIEDMQVSFEQRLASLPQVNLAKSSYEAYQRLLQYWGVAYVAKQGQSVCQFAGTIQLACLNRRGGLQELISLNRPAILTLYDKNWWQYKAVLLSLEGNTATISLLGAEINLDVGELVKWWNGEYMILWKRPASYRSTVTRGTQGTMVTWIADKLAIPYGDSRPQVYGDVLIKAVKTFQKKNGLRPDGDVGPLTVIALNNIGVAGGPRLIVAAD